MEQELPSAVHAECAILGCMLLDETAINDALEHLVADDFSLDSHRRVFTSICELSETGNAVDYITVMEDLRRRRELDSVGGPAWLASLSEDVPRKMNILGYCKIVKDKAVLRSLLVLGQTMMSRSYDQSEESKVILEDAEGRILELTQQSQTRGFSTIMDALKESGGLDAYVDNACDPVAMRGLATGFRDVDEITGGLQKSELIVIAARPSVGKTSLLINIATNVVNKDADAIVAIFSLEMSKEALNRRMICSVGNVSSRRMMEGFISKDERSRVAGATRWLAEKQIHVDDSSELTPMQMRAKCRRLKQRFGRLDLVGVDYLQLLHLIGRKYENRQQEVAAISRGMKALAKALEVPVVALAQLSRGSEGRADKRPMLSDLRESGQIEQDSDVVAFIHRQEIYEPDNDDVKGLAEIIFAKQRSGPIGVRKLAYIAELTKFADLAIQRGGSNAY